MSEFSNRLKLLREQNNLNKTEMAKKIGVTIGAYANYEYGNREPNFETMQKIADVFGVSIDELLHGNSNINPNPTNNSNTLISLLNNEIENIKENVRELELILDNNTNMDPEEVRYYHDNIGTLLHGIEQYEALIEQIKIPSQAFYIFDGVIYIAADKDLITDEAVKFDSSKYDILKVTEFKSGDEVTKYNKPEINNSLLADVIRKYSSSKYKIELYFLPINSGFKVEYDTIQPVNELQVISNKPYMKLFGKMF